MLPWVYTYVGSVLFQMCHLFQTHVASVLSGCCTCFTHMLQVFHLLMLHMFHTYVASVSSRCCICFAMATHVFSWCCKCFNCFGRMLQVFYLDVAKVDLVLHMLCGTYLPQPPAGPTCMRLGVEGRERPERETVWGVDRDAAPTSARAGMGNGAARESER
jgi:hypothetical protein